MNKPILITGSHRSGTTWVGRILATDESVVYIEEPFNPASHDRRFKYTLDTWFLAAEASPNESNILKAFKTMISRVQHPWHRAQDQVDLISSPVEFLRRLIWAAAKPKRVLLKDPIAIMSAEWLEKNLGCKVVITIRNPLAFVGSLVKWNWTFDFNSFRQQEHLMKSYFQEFSCDIIKFSENKVDIVDQACLLWNLIYHRITEYKRSHPDWLFIRYEDLVRNPLTEFQKIFHFVGLPYTYGIQQAIRFSLSGETGETDTTLYQARNQQEVLDTWKNRLSPLEISRVIESTADIARNFYSLENNEFI